MIVAHLTTRTRFGVQRFVEHEQCDWMWERLRAAFPDALACLLMPNHLHLLLLLLEFELEAASRRLSGILGHHARRFGWGPRGWEPVPRPKVIVGPRKVAREVRYVLLNECRAGLAEDPLETLFSTHRDIMGAVMDPWVTPTELAPAMGRPLRGFREWLHGYVSSDPSVAVGGTPVPRPVVATTLPTYPLSVIAQAAAAATRGKVEQVRARGLTRSVFVQLAWEQGWRNVAQLSRASALSTRRIEQLIAKSDPFQLDPARLCLGDPRLRRTADLGPFVEREETGVCRPQPRGISRWAKKIAAAVKSD